MIELTCNTPSSTEPVPECSIPIPKRYYNTVYVCEHLNAPLSRVRFWCRTFKIVIKRDNKRELRFTEEDLQKLVWVNQLTKEKYFTLKGIKMIIDKRISVKYNTR